MFTDVHIVVASGVHSTLPLYSLHPTMAWYIDRREGELIVTCMLQSLQLVRSLFSLFDAVEIWCQKLPQKSVLSWLKKSGKLWRRLVFAHSIPLYDFHT